MVPLQWKGHTVGGRGPGTPLWSIPVPVIPCGTATWDGGHVLKPFGVAWAGVRVEL